MCGVTGLEHITRPICPHGPPPVVPEGSAVPKSQSWDSLFPCEQKLVPLGVCEVEMALEGGWR